MKVQEIQKLENGTRVVGIYLIKTVEKRTAKNNKPYIDLTLADDSGDISVKWWDIKSHEDGNHLEAGKLCKIEATVSRFQEQAQLAIVKVRMTTDKDNVKVEDYVKSAPREVEDMMQDIRYFLAKIEDQYIRKIVIESVQEKVEKLKYFPAAKSNHHAFRGGLLYHTTSMLRLAEAVCELYTHLNKDLLFGGIILHDLEKVVEIEADASGVATDYTVKGKLLGHIAMGAMNVKRIADKIGAPDEQVDALIHVILAHHGKGEWGSPVSPVIPEAEAIHHIDNLDAKMNTFATALENVEPGNFSEKIFSLGNKQVYKTNF